MTHLGPSLRREKIRERPGRRAVAAVLASLLVNAALFLLLVRAGAFQMPAPGEVTRVALAPLSASQWAANRALLPADRRPAPPAPAPRPEEPEAKPKGQVVDIGPTNDQKPKDARFLAEHDSSVEKETRSRYAKAGYERALPTPSAPGVQSVAPSGQNGRADRSAPGREGPVAAKRAAEQKVAMADRPKDGEPAGARAPHEGTAPAPVPGDGEGGERRAGSRSDAPLITPGTLARVAGGPAPDHLEGVEEGEGTYLNARGWKYATYFNRIKEAVAAKWDPNTPLAARDPDGAMFGTQDRATLLGVTLDDTGHLKSLVVSHPSGLDFLDRAALAAFKNAEPFVNPPRGIVDAQGEIKFGFAFTVEFGRPGLRIFRSPLPGMP